MGSHKKRRKPSTSSDTETTSDEDSSPQRRKRSRSSKKKKTPKKRKHVSSSSDTSTDTSSSSEAEKKKSKKKKQKKKPKEKKIEKTEEASSDIPLDLMARSKSMAPITKEEWEKRQSVVRRVYDETTGRHRLIKGDGEVVEEMVSRDRHKTINQQATRGDGDFFQAQMAGHLKK